MRLLDGIVHRPSSLLQAIAPTAALAFAWWMGWGAFVAIGVAVAVGLIAAVVRPRRPGRWTE